jgi:hypothetical protein
MQTISTSLARCPLGQRDQFLGQALEGMKLFERHGATHTRLLAALTAGQASDVYALTNEFDSAEAYGAFVDDLFRDAEFETFMSRITSPDSPLTIISRTLATEVPLMRSGPAHHGAVVAAYIGRPERGRFEDCCELARSVFEFLEGHGASNCHLLEFDSAGARTGELLTRWEFDSMRSRGKALDAWTSDPEGQARAARLRAKDSPITITWSGLYRDVHM